MCHPREEPFPSHARKRKFSPSPPLVAQGYQFRINAIPRREMLAATGAEAGGGVREEGPSGKSREIGRKR